MIIRTLSHKGCLCYEENERIINGKKETMYGVRRLSRYLSKTLYYHDS